MAQLNIRGQVQYAPGPWGIARPAGGVALAIVDEDVGNASDTIWTGTTSAQGQYAGTTRDWRDTRSVTSSTPVGQRTIEVADAADLMLLKATATQRMGPRAHSLTVPFVPAPAGLPQPPIVLGWGPSGQTVVKVNGVSANTLSQVAQLVQSVFAVGSAVARHGVRREIMVVGELGEEMIAVVAELESELRAIEAQILHNTRHDILRQKARNEQAQTSMRAHFGGAVAAGVALGRSLKPGLPAGPDPWVSVRQRIQALPGLLAQRLRQRMGPRDLATGGRVGILCEEVLRRLGHAMDASFTASFAVAMVGASVVGASLDQQADGARLMAAVGVALVSCVVVVVQSLPALLALASMGMGSLGFAEASASLADASAQMSEFVDQGWLAAVLAMILVVCAIVLAIAVAPAEGWSWLVEQVIGPAGQKGLRLVLTR